MNNGGGLIDILRGRHVFHTDGNGLLLSYEGPGGEVTVPEGISRVCEEAFAFCSQVTGAVLPEGVRLVAARAFYRSGIRSVALPESLASIEEYAFSETPLERAVIPGEVSRIGEGAFRGAARLEAVRLPEGLSSLDPDLFRGCVSLKEVVLPGQLKYIQARAFMDCVSLEQVTLPDSVVAVWTQAFRSCVSLRELALGSSAKALGSDAFMGCTALRELRVPKGVEMTNGDAFGSGVRVTLSGPGAETGLLIDTHPAIYYDPGLRKVTVPEGVKELSYYTLGYVDCPEVLELPRSLKEFSWSAFRTLDSLRQIVTDRNAAGAKIARMLDVEAVDRKGRKFTWNPPRRFREWITKPDEENGGVCLLGWRIKVMAAAGAWDPVVVIPERIGGRPVTAVGESAFAGCGGMEAVYIPDTVKRIHSGAFARIVFPGPYSGFLFMRIPAHTVVAGSAFAGTRYITRESGRKPIRPEKPEEPAAAVPPAVLERAADDPAMGTGTKGRPNLKPNVWQYLDRLDREERIRALAHSFRVKGCIDGAGWASVEIFLDGGEVRFRISYIGSSLADFRTFAGEIGDGESAGFCWSAEPGGYPWRIQRRGRVFYVKAPEIGQPFFIPRRAFLEAVSGLTAGW